jgi:hypothetical protein
MNAPITDAEKAVLRANQLRDLGEVLASVAGRRLLWRILGDGRVFERCFTADALTTAWREGQREHALGLLREIAEEFPERWIEMQKENLKKGKG